MEKLRNIDIAGLQMLADEIDVSLTVLVCEEHPHRSHATLDQRVQLAGYNDACYPRLSTHPNPCPVRVNS